MKIVIVHKGKRVFQIPYLVQRLRKPSGFHNPFSFGGGIVNGGINKDVMEVLNQIWLFDYMGSTEFEWGAVPQALNKLAKLSKDGKLIACEYEIDEGAVYYICPSDIEDDVLKWIKMAAKEQHSETKGFVGLKDSMKGKLKYKGWIELQNPFMFFIDGEMFNNTRKLFGVK